MEYQEKEQKIDIFILLEDALRAARRLLVIGLVLVLVCSAGLTFYQQRTYRPSYQAYASFTVRMANPLYAGVSGYNERTAQIMADTFPSILTSDLLRRRVMEDMGVAYVPSLSVTATAQSSILTVTVRDSDPQRAYDVLNSVIRCFPEVSEFVVGSTVLVLLDESGVPTVPSNPFTYRGPAVKGALIGGGLWALLVLVIAILKNTVHNEEELKKTINTPCVGQIPALKLSRRVTCPLIHRMENRTGFTESVRTIRLRVEKAMRESNRKVLLVSSAVPGEGKTTVASNLAVSLARKGNRVLLVDCDLRNPSVVKALTSERVPLSDACSLADFLRERAHVREIVQSSEIENLEVISGGRGEQGDSTLLLTGQRMERLVIAARKLYDIVILDTPPCSLLADASEVAELADCGLMVIRQDYATRDQILDGVQRLSEGKLPLIGCVFNNVRRSASGSYGYGYGYGYGKKK